MLATIAPDGTIIPAGGTKEWLYRLVTFPAYFTPCPNCCGANRTPKREQLVTHFDTDFPTRVYCSHCPDQKTRGLALLQVRRSAFKDVVKATDILRFGTDVSGVQQYTLNGSKVIYLNRDQAGEKKSAGASAAPATCIVDGRAMMDRSSLYCSLKCKMHGEDEEFVAWQLAQDSGTRAALAPPATSQAAPPRPAAAAKRAPAPAASAAPAPGGIGGGAARPKKAARTDFAVGASPGKPRPASAGASARPVPAAAALCKPKVLCAAAGLGAVPLLGGVPAGLRPIRTHAPLHGTTPNSGAPFGDAAADASGCGSGGTGLLRHSSAGSSGCAHDASAAAWGGALPDGDWRTAASPSFATLGEGYLDDMEGCLSPKHGGVSSGSTGEWWLASSPVMADPFAGPAGFGGCELIDLDSEYSDAGLLLHWPPFAGASAAQVLDGQLALPPLGGACAAPAHGGEAAPMDAKLAAASM